MLIRPGLRRDDCGASTKLQAMLTCPRNLKRCASLLYLRTTLRPDAITELKTKPTCPRGFRAVCEQTGGERFKLILLWLRRDGCGASAELKAVLTCPLNLNRCASLLYLRTTELFWIA